MLRTHQENDYDNTILRLHIEKFDLKLLDESTGLKFNCLEILRNNHALFTKLVHKMGFCCFSDMTDLFLAQESIPESEKVNSFLSADASTVTMDLGFTVNSFG